MAVPIDVRDIYKFGKQVTEDRDAPVRISVLVEIDAAEDLLDAAREALRPRTAQAFVDVEVIEDTEPVIPIDSDAVVVLVGSAGTAVRSVTRALRARTVPVVAISVRSEREQLDLDLGMPVEDVLTSPDAATLVAVDLAAWLADRLTGKKLSFAVNFEFAREAVSEEIIRATALQNALIGVVAIIPGTDMPLMTANQVKMLLQLATAHGQRIGSDRLGELAAVVGGGFMLRAIARQALTAVPGFGWIIKGGIGYTGTMAMGGAALAWFRQGADISEVSRHFQEMTRRGRRGVIEVEAVDVGPDEQPTGSVQQVLEIGPADDGA